MDIRNTKEIKAVARERLEQAPQQKRIVLIYTALALGMAFAASLLTYVLELQIDQHSGLSGMSTRKILSTLQTVLPLVQSFVGLCLDVGYIAAMLRIARGQYASPNTLRLGFDRLWVLLRATIFRTMIYMGLSFACAYLSVMIFLITPLSRSAMEILMPLMEDMTVLNSGLVLDEAVAVQLSGAMLPVFILFGILYGLIAIPVTYNLRMVHYVIIDKPAIGALTALRESKAMMRRKRFSLFRLDLSLWWYHAALVLAGLVGYGDVILELLGVSLPWSSDVSYFLFYFLYLAAAFLVYFFLRNRAEVAYALAYDAVKPEEKKDSGVVLGNIFQM